MDVPSPADGTILTIHIKTGDTLSSGDLILDMRCISPHVSLEPPPPLPLTAPPPVQNATAQPAKTSLASSTTTLSATSEKAVTLMQAQQ